MSLELSSSSGFFTKSPEIVVLKSFYHSIFMATHVYVYVHVCISSCVRKSEQARNPMIIHR